MTGRLLRQTDLPTLDDSGWGRLRDVLARSNEWMVHSLGVSAGIGYPEALAVFLALDTLELAELSWNVYHHCEDAPVTSIPYSQGFISLPWTCPQCAREVEDEDELGYEIVCVRKALVVGELT